MPGAKQYLYEIVEREHPITIRGVMYRAASTENPWFKDTSQDTYNKVDDLLVQMRLGGLYQIPWDWISEESRRLIDSIGFSSPNECLEAAVGSYTRNHWETQPKRVLVFTEKAAMTSILKPVVDKWNVPFLPFIGFPSCTDLTPKNWT
jgi:hypothetical protein